MAMIALKQAATFVASGMGKAGEVLIKHMPSDKAEFFYRILIGGGKPGKKAPAVKVKLPEPISVPPTPVALEEESRWPLAVADVAVGVCLYYSWQEEEELRAAPRRRYLDPAAGLLQVLSPAAAAVVTRLSVVTGAAACAAAAAAGLGPIPAGLLGRRDLFLPLPPAVQPLHPIGYAIALAVALYPLPPRSLI